MSRAALIVVTGFLSGGLEADSEPDISWPGGTRAAVSLGYDDALDSQLDIVIPALNRYGLKGSFYLTLAGDTVRYRLEDWRAAARDGHELGNHTLYHPCSASGQDRDWVQPHRDLDRISAVAMVEEVRLANAMLNAIDGREERTFTVPCGDTQAAGENYVERVKTEFVAIRSYAGGVMSTVEELDPYAIAVFVPVDLSGRQLIAVAEEAAEKGTMAHFAFHGVGEDYLSVSRQAHEELLQHLADNPDIYWVDTFLNIMKFVKTNTGN